MRRQNPTPPPGINGRFEANSLRTDPCHVFIHPKLAQPFGHNGQRTELLLDLSLANGARGGGTRTTGRFPEQVAIGEQPIAAHVGETTPAPL